MAKCTSSEDCVKGEACNFSTGTCYSVSPSNLSVPPNWCKNKTCQAKTYDGKDWQGPNINKDPCRRMTSEINCSGDPNVLSNGIPSGGAWVTIPANGSVKEISKGCVWNPKFGGGMCETPADGGRNPHPECPSNACDYKNMNKIDGCKEEWANNYSKIATNNVPGMCVKSGCTKDNAENKDEKATVDDGSCIIKGCKDPEASNYNEELGVTEDDGTCEYLAFNLIKNENGGNVFSNSSSADFIAGVDKVLEDEIFNPSKANAWSSLSENQRLDKLKEYRDIIKLGPTLDHLKKVVNDRGVESIINNTDSFSMAERGYQVWKVGKTGKYKIEAWGGDGGEKTDLAGGLGAKVTAEFNFTKGDEYWIIVGIAGDEKLASKSCGSGGGGATWLVKKKVGGENKNKTNITVEDVLCVSGGGGGASVKGHPSGASGGPPSYPKGTSQMPIICPSGSPGLTGSGNNVKCDNIGLGGRAQLSASSTVTTQPSAAAGTYSSGGGGGLITNGAGSGHSNPMTGTKPSSSAGGKSFKNGAQGGIGGYWSGGCPDNPTGRSTITGKGCGQGPYRGHLTGGCEGDGGFGGGGGGAAHMGGGGGGMFGGRAAKLYGIHSDGGESFISPVGSNSNIVVNPSGENSKPESEGKHGLLRITEIEGSVGFENYKTLSISNNENVIKEDDNSDKIILGMILLLLLLILFINCKKNKV